MLSGGIQNQLLLLLPSFERIEPLKITLITKYTEYEPFTKRTTIFQLHKLKSYRLDTISFILKSFFRLIKVHKKERINIIYLSGHDNHIISPFIFRVIFKVPILMKMPTDYENYIRIVHLTEKQNFMAKLINYSWFKFYKWFVLKRLNFMRPINQKMYEDLINLNFPRKRILKLSNGIESKRFIGLKKKRHSGINFGFVGRLTKIKNLHFLLQVFKQYFSKYPEDKLLIYGEGPEKDIILRFIHHYNLNENVLLIGFEKQKEEIYPNLDVLINSSYGEGISNVILEAMATRTFVIASKVQGNTDLIEHGVTGLLYDLNIENDLLKQLNYYKNNSELVNQILDNALEEIKLNYDIEVISNKMYRFLKSNL